MNYLELIFSIRNKTVDGIKYKSLTFFGTFEIKIKVDVVLKSFYSKFMPLPPYNYPYDKYVSLGNNCLSRTFFQEWKIKPSKAQGELSMPFDLMVSTYKGVNELILNDFKDFFNDIEYDNNENKFINKNYDFQFNHDTDLGDDFSLFKKRYSNRIKNFLQLMESNEKILFIQHFNGGKAEDINKLYEVLKLKRKDKPFKILILNVGYKNTLLFKKVNQRLK